MQVSQKVLVSFSHRIAEVTKAQNSNQLIGGREWGEVGTQRQTASTRVH